MTPYRNTRWLCFLAASLLIHGAVLAWVEFSSGGVSAVTATIRVMLASAGGEITTRNTAPGAWQPASATRSRDLFSRPPKPAPSVAKAPAAPVASSDVVAIKPVINDAQRPAPKSVVEKTESTRIASAPRNTDKNNLSADQAPVAARLDQPVANSATWSASGDSAPAVGDVASTAAADSHAPDAVDNATSARELANVADNGALLALLHQAIDRGKRYPPLARRQRREGTATVRFRLSPSGELDAIDIDRSSGFGMLDTAAISAVSRVAPFAPARTLLSEATRFKVDVTFRLN